jgi:uncharacterized membrane protein HdeD (DUF308 family)
VKSVTALAVLVGIWFIVEGVFEIIGAFMIRRTVHRVEATIGGPPRADEGAATL